MSEGLSMEFLAIGVIAGVLSGLFGIGGGVVIVPGLVLIAGMKPETATGRDAMNARELASKHLLLNLDLQKAQVSMLEALLDGRIPSR